MQPNESSPSNSSQEKGITVIGSVQEIPAALFGNARGGCRTVYIQPIVGGLAHVQGYVCSAVKVGTALKVEGESIAYVGKTPGLTTSRIVKIDVLSDGSYLIHTKNSKYRLALGSETPHMSDLEKRNVDQRIAWLTEEQRSRVEAISRTPAETLHILQTLVEKLTIEELEDVLATLENILATYESFFLMIDSWIQKIERNKSSGMKVIPMSREALKKDEMYAFACGVRDFYWRLSERSPHTENRDRYTKKSIAWRDLIKRFEEVCTKEA